jgi:4-hydroxymandelate oxidase
VTSPEGDAFDPATHPTVEDVVTTARGKLTAPVRDYVEGGTESERTMARNLTALQHLLLQPRVLRNVEHHTITTTFLGVDLAFPVMPAPVGSVGILDPGGVLASARGSHRAGTAGVVPLAGRPSLEEVAAATDGPLFLQLYPWGDRPWMEEVVRRAEQAGYRGIMVTVDRSVDAVMRRQARHGFSPAQAHGPPPGITITPEARLHAQRWDWGELEWLRATTALPLVLKGVMSPLDAGQAVDVGVDSVYVSNHGGRALDGVPAAVEVLPSIVETVAGRLPVAVDGGFASGTDVVKALALGADLVLVGRLHCWALAAGGEAGVAHVLSLLAEEIDQAVALLGAASVADLDRSHLFGGGR